MRTQVLYGSRVAAAFKLLPFVWVVGVLFAINDGNPEGMMIFIILAVIGYGLWQAKDVIQPHQLELDRQGFVLRTSLGAPRAPIKWTSVSHFGIEGKDKKQQLVCYYRPEDGDSALQTLKLGNGWCLDGKNLFPAKLGQVGEYLSNYHSGMVSGQVMPTPVPATALAHKPRPQVSTTQARSASTTAPAATRSGAVYAHNENKIPTRVEPLLNGRPAPSRGLGWGLMLGGVIALALSAGPFMAACNGGLCGGGVWDVSDYRIWIFATLWTACLLAIFAGVKMVFDADRWAGR